MGKSIRTLFLVAFLGAIFSTTASAQTPCYNQGSWRYGIFTGSYSPRGYLPCYYRSGRDYRLGATMYWNQAGRNGIQSYVDDTWPRRYTHDMTDLNDNLTTYSNWWGTNFPNPRPDWDDDDGDGKWEEWEITVDNESFPVVSRNYWITFYARTVPSGYQNGHVAHTPAISSRYYGPGDDWNTYRFSTTPYKQYYSTTWNGLFDDEEEPKELPDGGKPDRENANEKPYETISFPQPVAIGDFHAQLRPEDKTIMSFVLAYEVETEQGTQTVYVGGVPSEFELFPLSRAEEELRSAPVWLGSARLLGVTSYRIERDIQNDEQK